MELHLAILDGIGDRYETPFFNNLKKYAQRPIGTFHALPIARGKSVFRSNWIRDMGHFYGTNLFLAESSATTGGLDSLLEPTGNIKKAQELTARAFGAKRAYFGTNGTSTSNKIVVQAVCQPGDIVIVDRNCHKSHHYGFVLAGRAAVLRRGVSADAVLDVRRGAARHHQEGAARLPGAGHPRPRQGDRPHELHVRRAHVQPGAGHGGVPGDQAGPDLPVGRGVVRLCAVQRVPPPPHGDGRGRHADRALPQTRPIAPEYAAFRRPTGPIDATEPVAADDALLPDPTRSASASTRRARRTSRCRPCGRAR